MSTGDNVSQLIKLHEDCGQSPWLDNITRGWITSGEMRRWIDRGVRGITSNPTIFQKAMASADYDDELARLTRSGASVEEAYWQLVGSDISAAADLLSGVHESSGGVDGWVSVEVSPALAHDTEGTIEAARELSRNLALDNLYVKVPATAEGIPVIVTLIFGLERYADVIEAYLSGLEAHKGTLSHISSVGSFFISRVDTEVDRRLTEVGTDDALDLLGTAAITQGKLAYQLAMTAFSGSRWDALEERGAKLQRPLWASTSTKNPEYPDTYYVDSLIGPNTVNTLPEATLEAFDDHGNLVSTLDASPEADQKRWEQLGELVDLDEVSAKLEAEGVASFATSFDEVLATLAERVGPSVDG